MNRVIITDSAIADLNEIWDFIALRSPEAADRVLGELITLFDEIGEMPGRGSPRDWVAPGLRGVPCWSYIVLYREHPGAVEIVRIMHGAQDIESEFEP